MPHQMNGRSNRGGLSKRNSTGGLRVGRKSGPSQGSASSVEVKNRRGRGVTVSSSIVDVKLSLEELNQQLSSLSLVDVHPQRQSPLLRLPPELLPLILTHLSSSFLVPLLPVCRYLHPIARHALLSRVSVRSSNRFTSFSSILSRCADPDRKGFTVQSLTLDPSAFRERPSNEEINRLLRCVPRLQELEYFGFEPGNVAVTLPLSLRKLTLGSRGGMMFSLPNCFSNLRLLRLLRVLSLQGLDIGAEEIQHSALTDLRSLKLYGCNGSVLAWKTLLFPLSPFGGQSEMHLRSLSVSHDRLPCPEGEEWIQLLCSSAKISALELWRTIFCPMDIYFKNVQLFFSTWEKSKKSLRKLTVAIVPPLEIIRGLGVKELCVRNTDDVSVELTGLLDGLKNKELDVLAVWRKGLSLEGEQNVEGMAKRKEVRVVDALTEWRWES
ncbi:hypothetical protein BT69DRAFT_1324748 [Atractiella rhizophila]|nr:hypothetical protein BT69DRAFT_1324748 [Atractiella rhizophila]